jgi:adenylate kinase family enzyme
MKRIAIVGCPGAGKTTFAGKLAKKTKLPVIHLDYYYHQAKYDYYNNKSAWITRVEQLIGQDEWIMDGNYSSTFELRFKRADTIIFFDLPRRTSLYSVVKRRFQYRNKQRQEMPSDWKEKANLEFLRYVWSFNGAPRQQLIALLAQVKDKEVIVFTNRTQAEKFLAKL